MKKSVMVSVDSDEEGFIGRECPECEMYFKLKLGTGLPIDYHICPYCGCRGSTDKFFTKDQIEYAQSVAVRKIMKPLMDDLHRSLKSLERSTRGGFIQFKVSMKGGHFPIKHYQEKILETDVNCDSCGLVFSIYGVFSNCPDCNKLNARVIFAKSIEASKKRLELSSQDDIDKNFREELLSDALKSAVSSFDSLGKALRNKHPSSFPTMPKNLFQNVNELDRALKKSFGKGVGDYMTPDDFDFLFKMFQVRHIYEHNAGVIDDDFVRKIPTYKTNKGRKYGLDHKEIDSFLEKTRELGNKIYSEVE